MSIKNLLIQSVLRGLSHLPLPLLRLCGQGLGSLFYYLPNRQKNNAATNLRLCFPQLSEAEHRRWLKASLQETAKTLLEMPAVWYGRSEDWLNRLEDNRVAEEIKQVLQQGKGIIIAMPHLGNFEISAHYFAQIGKATGLYRPPRQHSLEAIMLAGRSRPGQNRMVPTDRQGVKALYQALKQGEIIVILPDQQPKTIKGGAGVFAPFFDQPALTMTLINRLARKTGAPVYFIAFIRQRGNKPYRVFGLMGEAEIAAADAEQAAAALNRGVEQCVLQAPTQYQWTYRRFRQQPDGHNPYSIHEGAQGSETTSAPTSRSDSGA